MRFRGIAGLAAAALLVVVPGQAGAAVLTVGTRVRALSASIVQTPKGLKIAAFNPLHR